ncbi:hypothetical protein PHLCEN_2v1042 [Hermanssonia centrifuga]|uniref:DUF6535 domain-containing protein n=1 Tax=Hermanssonia centrifuga TaxID=98765 RepID=A0A2R6S4M6_9APHY|nr:hypothetical protein PHLCEN_2v1042 [Hermanssonia centrifuga]
MVIDGWKDELGNLLIFAGLFSAVVTSFTVASLAFLQDDPADTSAKVLTQISLQLSSLSFITVPGFINSTSPITTPQKAVTAFSPTKDAVTVNILWVTSLTLGLVAAFFAIMVQQWLRRMPLPPHLTTRQSIRMRYVRFDSLILWQVPGIVTLLPLLLQVAVVLFLVGLLVLLRSLNTDVALVFSIIFGIFVCLFAAATILPLIRTRCPYKSPLIPTTLALLQWCTLPLTLLAGTITFMGVLIYYIFYILIFANEPPIEGVFNIIGKLLSYTREFGEHMIVDVDRFWTNREHTILEAEKIDGKALSSVLYTLPARRFSVINMIHSLPQLPPTTATRIVLRWIALDLGNCDYHQDLFNVNGPRPVNPKVLARINQQLTDKFKDIMLAAVPQNTTGDIMSSSDSRRIASILSLLYEMRKWADMGFRARLLKLLVTIRDQQSIDYAIPIPDPVRMTPTILIYECCMDDISVSDIQPDPSGALRWATNVVHGAMPTGNTKDPTDNIALALAASATALLITARHPHLLEHADTRSEVRNLIRMLGKFMQPEVHGRHTMVTLRSKHPASVVLGNGTSGLLSRAIVSICGSLRDIAANNALPTRERRIGLIGDLAKLMEAMHHDHDLDSLKDARIHMTNLKSILSFDEDAALDSYSQFWAFVDGKIGKLKCHRSSGQNFLSSITAYSTPPIGAITRNFLSSITAYSTPPIGAITRSHR